MSEAITTAIALDGLWFLAFGALVAGLVRGFAGFGNAMIYLPVAGQVLGPFEALTTLVVLELTAPLIHIPRALKDGHPGDVLRLSAGALVAVPLGVLVLSLIEPEVFRWSVSLVALTALVVLITGFRYRGKLTKPLIYTTGALGGFLGGSVGIPGPPIIVLYMASTLPSSAIRANNTLFLIAADLILLVVFMVSGVLVVSALAVGGVLIAPYLLGNWLGAKLFRPGHEALYRRIAYAIIAASALTGLPIWD